MRSLRPKKRSVNTKPTQKRIVKRQARKSMIRELNSLQLKPLGQKPKFASPCGLFYGTENGEISCRALLFGQAFCWP
jgi:hypothetical protein